MTPSLPWLGSLHQSRGGSAYLKAKHAKTLRQAAKDPVGYSLSMFTRTDLAIISGELAKQRPNEPLATPSLQLGTALTDGVTGDLLFAEPAAQALELMTQIRDSCAALGIPFSRFPKP